MESLLVVILSLLLNSSVNAIIGKEILTNVTECDEGTVDEPQGDYSKIFNSYRQEFSKSNQAYNIRELCLYMRNEKGAKEMVKEPPSEHQHFLEGLLVLYVRNPTPEMGFAYAHNLWLNPSTEKDEFYDPTPQGYYKKQLQYRRTKALGCASAVYSCTQNDKHVTFKKFACYFTETYSNHYGSTINQRKDSNLPCDRSCFNVSEKYNNLCIQNSFTFECNEIL